MEGRTHLLTSAVAGYFVTHDWKGAVAGGIFGLLPDIDEPRSLIGRPFFFLSGLLNMIVGHRTMTHSLLALLVVWASLLPFSREMALAAVAGAAAHIIGDMLTGKVKVLWPVPLSVGLSVPRIGYHIIRSDGQIRVVVVHFVVRECLGVRQIYQLGAEPSRMGGLAFFMPIFWKGGVVKFMNKDFGGGRHVFRRNVPALFLMALMFLVFPVVGHAAPLDLSPRDSVTPLVEAAAGNLWEFVKGILWVAVAVVLIVAAFYFLGAGGDSRRIEKGRNMIILAVVFAAIALYAPDIVGLIRSLLGG